MILLRILGILILAIVIVLAIYLAVLRPWSHHRGATDAEVSGSLPGDDLVPTPKIAYTQAITIDRPAEEVWPWLVQIGYQRAGWYTYDWAYKIMGADVAGTDNKDQINTKTTAIRGDWMHLVGDGSNGWYIVGKRGTWAEES